MVLEVAFLRDPEDNRKGKSADFFITKSQDAKTYLGVLSDARTC